MLKICSKIIKIKSFIVFECIIYSMIKATLTEDKNWLKIDSDSSYELAQLHLYFTKKINDWYILKKKNPNIKVDETFMSAYNIIPVGLWRELIKACNKNLYSLEFVGLNDKLCDNNISQDEFNEYIDKLFANSKIVVRDYQRESAFNCLYYRRACIEISTSGGKTLIAFIIFKFLREKYGIKHFLFVTPNTNLTTQTKDKFLEYEEAIGNITPDWTWREVYSGAKSKKGDTYDKDIIFGNYQSLCKKKEDFFKNFDVVINDETQHGTCSSIRTIFKKCTNSTYRIGMTGTFPPEESYNSFVLQSNIGAYVYNLPSQELIYGKGFATPVHVHAIYLDYLSYEAKQALYNLRKLKKGDNADEGMRLLNLEREQARASEVRFKYICDLIKKTTKNTLVIFTDIQNKYGWRVYKSVKEYSDKNVYYIDGDVDPSIREEMVQSMEDDTTGKTVIVASIGCFSEGIDIRNLWNIFLIETTKSDNLLRQILGRGMRQYPGKEKTTFIDIIDDFRFYPLNSRGNPISDYYTNNYLLRHGEERKKIYESKGFPYKIIVQKLENALF